MAKEPEMITLAQAAEYAGVPKRTIQYAAHKGYLWTHQPAPNYWLTTREEVDRWLRSENKRAGRVKKL